MSAARINTCARPAARPAAVARRPAVVAKAAATPMQATTQKAAAVSLAVSLALGAATLPAQAACSGGQDCKVLDAKTGELISGSAAPTKSSPSAPKVKAEKKSKPAKGEKKAKKEKKAKGEKKPFTPAVKPTGQPLQFSTTTKSSSSVSASPKSDAAPSPTTYGAVAGVASVIAGLSGMYQIDQEQQNGTPKPKAAPKPKAKAAGPEKSADERRKDVQEWVKNYRTRTAGEKTADQRRKDVQEWVKNYRTRTGKKVMA
ncbi:PSI-F [Pseudoscourfieldia marina]